MGFKGLIRTMMGNIIIHICNLLYFNRYFNA